METLDENSLPKEPAMLRTPLSGKIGLRKTLGSRNDSAKSVKIGSMERSTHRNDDSLARVVTADDHSHNGAIGESPQAVMHAWKPSNLKRLGHQNDIDRIRALESENARLKEALKGLKAITEEQSQLAMSNAAIVEGAKRYVIEKAASAQKSTPQRRQHNVLSVRVKDWEKMKSHVEFTIEVSCGSDSKHAIKKRYSEFLGLRQRLLIAAEMAARSEGCSLFWGKKADELNSLTLQTMREAELPKKVWFGNFDDSTLETRKDGLQDFLDQSLRSAKRAGRGAEVRGILSDWLGIHRSDEDNVWCDDRIKPLREFDTRSRQARVSEAFEHVLSSSPAVNRTLSEQLPVACSPASNSAMMQAGAAAERDLELL